MKRVNGTVSDLFLPVSGKIIEFNENNFQWDGMTKEGNELPSGTYYYILELKPSQSTQTGPITIIR